MLRNNTKSTDTPQALDHPVKITRFRNEKAFSKKPMRMSMRELAIWIKDQSAAEKGELPWLKLATIGPNKSEKGCYRANANMEDIEGVESDYDAEKMQPEEAAAIAEKRGIATLFYTTASRTPETPRWRAFCPLSGPFCRRMRGKTLWHA